MYFSPVELMEFGYKVGFLVGFFESIKKFSPLLAPLFTVFHRIIINYLGNCVMLPPITFYTCVLTFLTHSDQRNVSQGGFTVGRGCKSS